MNVGRTDRIFRIALGIILIVSGVFLFGDMGSVSGALAMVTGSAILLTGLIRFCPLFKVFGLSSRRSQ